MERSVREKVHAYYWEKNLNCAQTALLVLCDLFGVMLAPQTLQAATGLNGAGRHREQCGQVEGALMFLGIFGGKLGKSPDEISDICYRFADAFIARFSSLRCVELRPDGFHPEDPPFACEGFTGDVTLFVQQFVEEHLFQNGKS